MGLSYLDNLNHRKTIRPYESDTTPAWDNRDTENQKKCIQLLRKIEQDANKVWVIRMQLKGPRDSKGHYPYRDYPMFFPTQEHASDYFSIAPQFHPWPEGVKSVSYEAIRFPMPKRPQLKARSKKLGICTKDGKQ